MKSIQKAFVKIVYNYGQKGKLIAYFIGRDYNNTIDNKKEEKNMAQVTGDTMIGELLQIDENIAPILLNIGMHCLGCPSSQMETIEQAAMVHGIDSDLLVEKINAAMAAAGK